MDNLNRRFVEQLKATEAALGTPLASGPGTRVSGLRFAYQRGTVLTPATHVYDALGALNGTARGERWARLEGPEVRAGLRRITVGAAGGPHAIAAGGSSGPVGDDQDVLDALALLNGRDSAPYSAAPNHVISVANVNMCPADEPEVTTDPLSLAMLHAPRTPDAPHVLIVDTGLLSDRVEAFPYVGGDPRVAPLDADGYIREYVGHGTFIAQMLAGVAPGVNIWVSNLLPDLGAAFDDVFGARLIDALESFEHKNDGRWPDIISLSAGSPMMDLDQPLPGHEPFLAQLHDHPQTLLVAAAGNCGGPEPFYPAALAWTPQRADGRANIISVGALRHDGTNRACFSDFGPWVSVYAPGERLVAKFLDDPLIYQHSTTDTCRFLPYGEMPIYDDCTCTTPPHVGALSGSLPADTADFHGFAKWSGTSFATPIVAGMVARGMAAKPHTSAPTIAHHLIETLVPLSGSGLRAVFPQNYTGPHPA
jgi:subtilisin family serine protease